MPKTADAGAVITAKTRVLPFVYAAHLFGMLAWLTFNTSDDQHFSRLAESFLQWKLVLLPSSPITWADTALFEGHQYSPFGPFPAILSMPLLWAGCFHQGTLSLAVLAFRSTGFEQVGYRFSLDFLPFVFWLLMRSRFEMNNRFKGLISLALVVNVCLTAFFLSTGVDRRQADSSPRWSIDPARRR